MEFYRPIHADFQHFLDFKDAKLIALYTDLRTYIINQYPDAVELLYHTHALTSVYSISDKLADAFCMIPIYSGHLHLGFSKGALLDDPHELLVGTGKYIRHIKIGNTNEFKNSKIKTLIREAINIAIADMDKPTKIRAAIISKIKR